MAMRRVPLYDAKNRLSEVLRGVESGAPVELTRHGKPVAVLVDADSFHHAQQAHVGFAQLFHTFCQDWSAEMSEPSHPDEPDVATVFANVRSRDAGRNVLL